jgi:hypothetical protein
MRRRYFGIAVAAVALALGALSSASEAARPGVFVNCQPTQSKVAFPAFKPRRDPTRCDIIGEPEDEANLLQLRQADWSDWGAATTATSGRALNNHPGMGGPASNPVQVRLSRIRRGCHGNRYYTRARITTHFGTGVLRLTPGCKEIPISLG